MAQIVFDRLEDLVDAIRSVDELRVITIDGIPGSGKSHLAKELAPIIKATSLDLDDFLNKNRGGFIEFLRYDDLDERCEYFLCNSPIILAGDCMNEVIERIGIEVDAKVYVKRLIAGGLWHDGNFMDLGRTPEEVIAREIEMVSIMASISPDNEDTPEEVKLSGLRQDIVRYHFKHKPHLKADYVFKRYT